MAYSISRIHHSQAYYIPGRAHIGKQFIIRGRVPAGCDTFAVNLQEAPESTEGQIQLHFNPRPGEGCVVRNSCDGGWHSEERDAPFFPFDQGRTFLIRIQILDDGFKVYVNGYHFCDFEHRLDFTNIHYLYLSPGAEYYDVTFQDAYGMPYAAEMPNGMSVGKAVRIRGVATDSDGFSLNFACDCENETCAFHFNPRPNEGEVVKNSNLGGWGDEERDSDNFPFSPGSYFDCLFVCTEDGYLCYANAELFSSFAHRCPIEDITHFYAKGDVTIASVEYFEPLDDDFVKMIPSGLEKGDTIVCRGFYKPGGDSFAINFMNGDDPDDDIAFHFNPRRGEGQVVMNDCIGGGWHDEEREDIPPPLLSDIPFEIAIVTKKNKFKIYVNGKKYVKFAARGEVEDIKGVNIKGDAYIYQVKLNRKLEKPYMERIPGGLRENGWVVVHGTPKKSRGGFAINLRCGDDEDSDIAMHFNPRLNEGDTVRNSCEGGSWQDEERDQPCFPFEKKDTFEVAIHAQPDKFVTYVNGEHYIDFNHRLSLDSVCHVNLTGDAEFQEPEFFY